MTPEEEGKLIIRAEDTLIGVPRRIPVDMVILSVGLEPQADADAVRRMFGISCSHQGWFTERHPKLAPVSTATDGIFLAGACQGPKDIPDTVAQAGAAAAEALAMVVRGHVNGAQQRILTRTVLRLPDLYWDVPYSAIGPTRPPPTR